MGRKKQPDQTIAQILDVAQKLFLANGYEQTTMQDIVDHLDGLSRGAIYHHFKSKEDIIKAVTKQLYLEGYGYNEDQEIGLTALEKLRKRWTHSYNYHVRTDILLMSASLLKNPKYLAVQFEECIAYVVPDLIQLFVEGNQDGSMQVENPEVAAEMIGFLLNTWCIPAIYPGTAEQAVARFTMLCQQAESLGVPVFSEELLLAYRRYAERYTE